MTTNEGDEGFCRPHPYNVMNKDKYFVYDSEHKCWMHRTPLKCFVNPILRFIQFYTDAPFVIYSECEENNGKWL